MTQAANNKTNQMELPGIPIPVADPKPKKARKKTKKIDAEHLPPNLAHPVKVKVPDFSDPNRPKTCLEVDFPIVPINRVAKAEVSSGPGRKPVYQMSKWWARRASSVFRAMLIAAAMEAPSRENADGSVVLDENGIPEPDLDETHKAVWDVCYADHQKAGNFKHLKVLDCFMGGGTTLVEGSRLGFQMSGVDLNPVAWFVVKNELACTDPKEVERFFDKIEAEVKPQIQPFYVTDCPRGHKGKWFRISEPDQSGTAVPGRDPAVPSMPDVHNAVFEGYRRNLPHWRLQGATYFVTWRLHPKQHSLAPDERTAVVSAIRHFDRQRYHLLGYVVMDDHVHVIVQPVEGHELTAILHSWKSYTANQLQRRFERRGAVWQDESFDRVIRDEDEFFEKLHYILNNPLKRWPEIAAYEWAGVHGKLEVSGTALSSGTAVSGCDSQATGGDARATDSFATDTLMPPDFDPCTLPPDERKKYRYEGPEVIYTFWAKHGPCVRPDCDHRTPIFRSPVIAEKKLGVKYMELTCKQCKTAFHAELGNARMAPAAERVVLENELPFTELSQPFAKRLLDYAKGNKGEKFERVFELLDMVDDEPGLMCPKCGTHAGQWLRNVLNMHKSAQRVSDIDKKHLKILPARNGTKPVYCYLLIHPDWLAGSPGSVDGRELGGYIDAPVEDTAAWYEERLRNLKLIEVRGRIKLSEDTSHLAVSDAEPEPEDEDDDVGTAEEEAGEGEAEDRKTYGLPKFIRLSDGQQIDTRRGTVPKKSTVACGHCGQPADCLDAVKTYTESKNAQRSAPVSVYAVHGYCPDCDEDAQIYNGRFFAAFSASDAERLANADREWEDRREGDLKEWWPRSELPYTWMTHHLNGGIPNWGFTHFYRMFNHRQLVLHAMLLRTIEHSGFPTDIRDFCIGAFQQFLRLQNMFCMWNIQANQLEPFFSNPHYHPKQLVIENGVFSKLGRGNWASCRQIAEQGAEWCLEPWDKAIVSISGAEKSISVQMNDRVRGGSGVVAVRSSTELDPEWNKKFDAVITDPPFGDNLFYGDLSNFFYVWLRLALKDRYSKDFGPEFVPRAQEAVADRSRFPDDGESDEENGLSPANQFYQSIMTECWSEARRTLKDGGILAFTFHHSAFDPWVSVLASLFDAGFILEATYPISSDETKGAGGQFGSRKIEYDIIHVCRKRLEEPQPVSWPKMRQWVKTELKRLRRLLESYKARELSEADIRVILCGKALEFYSKHYGKVYTAEGVELSISDALSGIDQLLDEDTSEPGERPPSILQPFCYKFLWLFGSKASMARDEVTKNLRGTGRALREFVDRGWVEEKNKVVYRVPIKEQFEKTRQRPRKEMKTEIDQAHFLIGAALHGSGLDLEKELSRNTWAVRRSVEAVLQWYAKTAAEPEIKDAAALAATLLRKALETNRAQLQQEQGFLWDDLEDVA